MDRRLLISALACWPLARLQAQEDGARPRHRISAGELHKALSTRFPLGWALPGVLQLQVSAPGLLLLPARNKLGATLLVEAKGPALQQSPSGEIDLLFGVRYEASDRSLRAHQPELLDTRMPGLSPEGRQAIQKVLSSMAREALGELVLHRFTPRELALADTMGFEPDTVTVLDDGLLVVFRPAPRR